MGISISTSRGTKDRSIYLCGYPGAKRRGRGEIDERSFLMRVHHGEPGPTTVLTIHPSDSQHGLWGICGPGAKIEKMWKDEDLPVEVHQVLIYFFLPS